MSHVHSAAEREREAVRALAEGIGLQVWASSDAAAFLNEIPPETPGCVVLGARIGAVSALQLQQELVARNVHMPVIIAAAHADVTLAVTALKAGAMDVIERPLLTQRIVPAILRALAADLTWRASRLESDDIRLRFRRLTPREREILELVIKGQTSGIIAEQLGIQEKTVGIHRSNINKKMRARNAVELTKLMHSMGEPGHGTWH